MPIVVRPFVTPKPPEPGLPVPPPIVPVGTIRATWTDPDGQEWELTGPSDVHGVFTRPQIGGWGANPVTIVTDPLARGGVMVRHVRAEPRRLTWPLHIHGEDPKSGTITHELFLARYRALVRAFTLTVHRNRPGILRVWRPDGTAREIDCWYEDGLSGEPGENWVSANPAVTLLCPDGYWRDVTPQRVYHEYASAGIPYLDPYLTVSTSQVLGDVTITNRGEVAAWPRWTITGPAASITATNHTLGGAAFTITYSLAPGQTITIDTTGGRPTVRGPGGINLVGHLNWPGAELWPLAPGSNQVSYSVQGASPGTSVELVFYPRYEAA